MITPVLIIGALIGRLRFVPYVVFFIAWSLLVYSPLIHWVWGGGILAKLGYFDFAGGLPARLIAGFSSLAAVWAVGNRQTPKDGPSNMMYVAIGVGILWAGWLIFNASAASGANEIACLAAMNTLLSGSTGCIAWSLLAYFHNHKVTVGDVIFGAFAGLVISTPTAGFVSLWVMLPAGFIGGVVCFYDAALRIKKNWNHTLDVWALHRVGGFVGVLLLGLFANPDFAPAADALVIEDMMSSMDMISPPIYHDISGPAMRQLIGDLGDIPAILHICGKINPFVEDMIDTGASAFSVDTNVNIGEIQSKIAKSGRYVVVVGGIDAVNTLFYAKGAGPVREEGEKSLRAGYDLLAPSCSIPPATSLEKLQAMVEVAKELSIK